MSDGLYAVWAKGRWDGNNHLSWALRARDLSYSAAEAAIPTDKATDRLLLDPEDQLHTEYIILPMGEAPPDEWEMTESDWLTDTNPAYLLWHARSRSLRKQCLHICACWATVRDLLVSENSRAALESLERVAEANPTYDTVKSVYDVFHAIGADEKSRAWHAQSPLDADEIRILAADLATGVTFDDGTWREYEEWHRFGAELARSGDGEAWNALGRNLCGLVRCVYGNPFRPTPVVAPAWLAWNGGTVRKLAESAYTERTLPEGTLNVVRLALLADALEDAGCTERDLLGHLRPPGPHVRGCWAVDLVLAKE
jgi:hypothetical protein